MTQADQASPDVRDLLETAWNTIHDHQVAPWRKLAVANGVERFRRFLDAEAYTDAALMLVPEGWSWSIGEMRGIGKFRGWLNDHNTPDGIAVRSVDADAETAALALAAAALRAKGPGHEQ